MKTPRRAWLLALPLFLMLAEPAPAFTMWLTEGRANRVYLLGSVHLLRQSDYPLPAVVDRAYADADTLVMELDMDDIDPLSTQATINRLGLLPAGKTLADVLGPDQYEEVTAQAAALDVPIELLAQSEPWLAAITIEQLVLTRLGFDPRFGVEMMLAGQASKDRKSIEGLETIDEQLGLLDGLSAEAQRDLLMQTLEEGSEIAMLMDAMIAAWRSGDVEHLEDTMLVELADYPELYRTIVADRNGRWMESLEAMLEDERDYLIVVGALHLVGEDGLPAMLEKAGYEVIQLDGDAELPED
jgi:uncharacterized protein YbaP (TraB family)